MAKLTREQIIAIEYELAVPYGMAKLKCDGFTVDVRAVLVKPLKYELMVYINGEFKAAWLLNGGSEEAKRFLRPVMRPKYPAKFRADMTKIWGKRKVLKEWPDLNDKDTRFAPTWLSAKQMLRHFGNTCTDIELVCTGYPLSEEKAA